MSTYRTELRGGLNFGDICEADFLYDAFVNQDAHSLTRHEASAAFAKRQGWGEKPIPYFVALPGASADGLVLAHGSLARAICLSDDCAIATALGRGHGSPRGRLLFAPVVEASQVDLDALEKRPSYGRFALRGETGDHSIVALRQCFMVDSRAVHSSLAQFVVLSCSDATRDGLANQWSAYACRRGPIVVDDNVEKYANLLVSNGVAESAATALALALGKVAAVAWSYEGAGIESAGQAADLNLDPAPVLNELGPHLDRLSRTIGAAQEAIRETRLKLVSANSDG